MFKPKRLRHGVRLELLDVLVEQQGPRAVLLVALEAWSGPHFHTELEERAPLVQRDARRRRRLQELEERVFVARSATDRDRQQIGNQILFDGPMRPFPTK